MPPLKPPYNILHFVIILLSLYLLRYGDISTSTPHFSYTSKFDLFDLLNLKFKFDKFLPCALFPTQNEPKEPKRSKINSHLDHETAVDILLEDAACRCFDLAHTDLAQIVQPISNHLKMAEHLSLFLHCPPECATMSVSVKPYPASQQTWPHFNSGIQTKIFLQSTT